MRRSPLWTMLLVQLILANIIATGQTRENPQSPTAVFNFEDGKQISARYQRVTADRSEGPPTGKVWMPGGSAIILFTSTELTVGSARIPPGTYTIYFIPGKKDWKLIVSKNLTVESKYDEQQDLVRAAMEKGTLSEPENQLKVSFVRTGSKQCEMNIDYGKTKAWVEFKEK
jgi:Protein of unknown function (DUF2911)